MSPFSGVMGIVIGAALTLATFIHYLINKHKQAKSKFSTSLHSFSLGKQLKENIKIIARNVGWSFLRILVVTYPAQVIWNLHKKNLLKQEGNWKEKTAALPETLISWETYHGPSNTKLLICGSSSLLLNS